MHRMYSYFPFNTWQISCNFFSLILMKYLFQILKHEYYVMTKVFFLQIPQLNSLARICNIIWHQIVIALGGMAICNIIWHQIVIALGGM
jgi:hypothetical protein